MLELRDVSRVYGEPGRPVHALRACSLTVGPGERVLVMGPSGSGKSTLLHLAAGLDRPTAGRVLFDGADLASLDETARARLRRREMGFVFQFFNLLPTLTAAENVALPLDLAGVPAGEGRRRAAQLLEQVGLAPRADRFPEELSGGEMQRVAVARALVAGPRLLLADEPTGNLDSATGAGILDLLAEGAGDGRALVLVTHDPAARRIATRILDLHDGRLAAAGEGPA